MKAGIVSYGGYIPRYRIRPKDIGVVWGADGEAMDRLDARGRATPRLVVGDDRGRDPHVGREDRL